MSEILKTLDKITDMVLAYRPHKPKGAKKKVAEHKKSIDKNADMKPIIIQSPKEK